MLFLLSFNSIPSRQLNRQFLHASFPQGISEMEMNKLLRQEVHVNFQFKNEHQTSLAFGTGLHYDTKA
jgi:hypothetical protein